MQRRLVSIVAIVGALLLMVAATASADTGITYGKPFPGTVKLEPIRAADPFGGPDHTFATWRSTFHDGWNNKTYPSWCMAGVSVLNGKLGQVDWQTDAFTPTTLDELSQGTGCGGGLPMTFESSGTVGGHDETNTGGWIGGGVTSVAIQHGNGWKPLDFSADGAFMAVLPGLYRDADTPNSTLPVIPVVRITATLCGPHERHDLLHSGGTTKTGPCEATMYWPSSGPIGAASHTHRGVKLPHHHKKPHHKKKK